ncbi:hypothetical protein D6779_06335 [Candidatus Parcubacteria bacterium]|nr:MAG: hypothetical protein D6779_06335 [Candidatus Parcubacteria bacterium]
MVMNLYQEHFGFQRPPFSNTPTTTLFSGVGDREKVLSALLSLIHHGDPILKIVGEVGTGKTTIIHNLIGRLQRDEAANHRLTIIFMPSPAMSAQDAFRFIARELGIELNDSTQKADLFDKIAKKVLNNYIEHDKKTLLIIDEAHTMPPDAIEEVRLLTNIETGDEKLIQIVLVGQPELDEMLEQKAFRQLKSRITHNVYLHDLNPEDTWNYLNVRTRLAGYRGADLFSKRVAKRIHAFSKGKPRLINIIADRALISACAEGAHQIADRHVKEAFQALNSENAAPKSKLRLLPAAAISLFLIGVGLVAGNSAVLFKDGLTDDLLAHSQKIIYGLGAGGPQNTDTNSSANASPVTKNQSGHQSLGSNPSSSKKAQTAQVAENDLAQIINSLPLPSLPVRGAMANLAPPRADGSVEPKSETFSGASETSTKRFWVQSGTFFNARIQKVIGEFPPTSLGPTIWEYQGKYRGKPSKVSIVLYGPFQHLEEANKFVNSLPSRIKKRYKPFVLNEDDLQEIKPERKVKVSLQDG